MYNVEIERRAAFARPAHAFRGRTQMPCYVFYSNSFKFTSVYLWLTIKKRVLALLFFLNSPQTLIIWILDGQFSNFVRRYNEIVNALPKLTEFPAYP